ncbi:MAG TPA: TolC family protein [Gemmatimonadaceae bacterium]|nr:TolC family protein [Gemmatimonadaceae bacterium]
MIRRRAGSLFIVVAGAVGARTVAAQLPRRPITRADAIGSATTRGLMLRTARADTLLASGQLIAARAFANPGLTASYTKSAPQYHAELELPFPAPWLRRARIGAAASGVTAARLRFDLARASAALDADTSYTLAIAARARALLSTRTAADADTLLRMAIARRDAGDASDLDVELARVNAGQQANAAAGDSLVLQSALLDLQLAMGLDADSVVAWPVDSLIALPPPPATGGEPLAVAAAVAGLRAATSGLTAERRAVWGVPSLIAGIETHDPSGSEPGILPVVGVALPLPFFDRNRGGIVIASAERERAVAELALARLESRTRVAQAERTLGAARARVERGRALVESANRVAAMSLAAYREGASTLPNVLEAQRNARDILAQYVDDLARAWIASATLRALTLTAAPR